MQSFEKPERDVPYCFEGLPPGDAVLRVTWGERGHDDWVRTRYYRFATSDGAAIQKDPQRHDGLTLQGTAAGLRAAGRNRVLVVAGAFTPDLCARHAYSTLDDFCANVPVSPEGRFRVEGLDPGTYTVIAIGQPQSNGRDLRQASTVIDLQADKSVQLRLP